MTDAQKESVALFRYALIAPVLNATVSKKLYLQEVCSKFHDVPFYGKREFTAKTLQSWIRHYQKHGLSGLLPKQRSDRGMQRAISPDLAQLILNERANFSESSASLFYRSIVKRGLLNPSLVSYHSVYRLLKNNAAFKPKPSAAQLRRRFAHSSVNFLWQTDASVGPYLKINGKALPTHLFAIIDDCSRVITFAQFFFTEKQEDFLFVLKQAVLRRGIPKILYTDNGKVFCCKQLEFACANLQINLVHAHPYDPQAKGKIERFFGTVRSSFYPLLKESPVHSLDELNSRFQSWLELNYHQRVHSSLNCTPLEKFTSQPDNLRLISNPDDIQPFFWPRVERKVLADATISVNKIIYEVPPIFVGQKLDLRFNPDCSDSVFAFKNGKQFLVLKKANLSANAHAKRDKPNDSPPISFGSLFASEGL